MKAWSVLALALLLWPAEVGADRGGRWRRRRRAAAAAVVDPAVVEARARAAQLELGGHVAANILLVGPPRPEWIAAAGGATPPADLLWPLEGGELARGFGTGWQGRHRAVDLMAPRGTPIRAAERGIVAYAAWGVQGYGALTIVIHPGGWVTLYGHASKLLRRPGQLVARGEVIAQVGQTGRANGDHLHFELRRNGARVDPASVLVGLPPGVVVEPGPPLDETNYLWRVRRGQTLRWIARRTGVTVEGIRALNAFPPDGEPAVGDRIIVPNPPPRPPRLHTRRRATHY